MRDLVRLVLAVIVAALAFCGGVRCRGGLSVLMNWNGESKHWSANADLCSTYQLPGSIAHHNPVRAPARSPLSGRGGRSCQILEHPTGDAAGTPRSPGAVELLLIP